MFTHWAAGEQKLCHLPPGLCESNALESPTERASRRAHAGGDADDDGGDSARGGGGGVCGGPGGRYVAFARRVQRDLVERPWFEGGILLCIIAVGVATGVDVTYLHGEDGAAPAWTGPFTAAVATATSVVFALECALKIVARGVTPLAYFTDPSEGSWNTVDFTIVATTLAFFLSGAGGGSTVAIMRLVRLVRVMAVVPELRVLLFGVLAGMRAVTNILALLVLIVYLFAVLGVSLFAKVRHAASQKYRDS